MSLRGLDDRFASRGPLGLVREVPQLGLLVVTAVFVAGSAAALTIRDDARPAGSAQGQTVEGGLSTSLGPSVGSTVEEHLARARERAVATGGSEPRARHLALVSLSEQRTPAEVSQLLTRSALTARRAYLRAPVAGGLADVLSVDVDGDLLSAVRTALPQAADRKVEQQRELVSLGSSIEPTNANEAEFKAFYEAAARTAGEEAAAYRGTCTCVVNLVVDGTASQLADLAAVPGVRGVELARKGAELDQLRISPLLPEATGVVQAPAQAPGRP